MGFDIDPDAVTRARANIERAGLSDHISVEVGEIRDLSPEQLNISEAEQTWILANPPYGNRLGRDDDLIALYRLLGDRCKVFPNAILGLLHRSESWFRPSVYAPIKNGKCRQGG